MVKKISKTMTADQIAKISKEIFSGKKQKNLLILYLDYIHQEKVIKT